MARISSRPFCLIEPFEAALKSVGRELSPFNRQAYWPLMIIKAHNMGETELVLIAFRTHQYRRSSAMKRDFSQLRHLILLAPLLFAIGLVAQTIHVDATPSHVTNTFSPIRAFGATVDRIPSNT